jgi:DNA invertase Pin-like site-specific DNA recombinase
MDDYLGRIVGYAREIGRPSLAQQRALLVQAGCHPDQIWGEGADTRRTQLDLAMLDCRRRDTFMVASLECVWVPRKRCRQILEDLPRRGVHFVALDMGFDTRGPNGDQVIPALLKHLDVETTFRSTTTLAGLAKANSEGRVGGRRPVLSPEKRAQAIALIEEGQLSMTEIAKRLGVSRSSLYNANLSARPKEKSRH